MSLSQGAWTWLPAPPLSAPAPLPPKEVMDVPDNAAETPDDPSDKAEPDTRLLETMSDGLGLSKLRNKETTFS